jgi:hypothetical protein
MRQSRQPKVPLETQLGLLAMRFRSTRDESERDKAAAQDAQVVDSLIASGKWKEMPAFEDMLCRMNGCPKPSSNSGRFLRLIIQPDGR